eukprot:7923974-Prorocentrum_lima.AAC.1
MHRVAEGAHIWGHWGRARHQSLAGGSDAGPKHRPHAARAPPPAPATGRPAEAAAGRRGVQRS